MAAALKTQLNKIVNNKSLNVNGLTDTGIGSRVVDSSTTLTYWASKVDSRIRANEKNKHKIVLAAKILGISKVLIDPAVVKKVSAKKPAVKKVSVKGKAPAVKKVSAKAAAKASEKKTPVKKVSAKGKAPAVKKVSAKAAVKKVSAKGKAPAVKKVSAKAAATAAAKKTPVKKVSVKGKAKNDKYSNTNVLYRDAMKVVSKSSNNPTFSFLEIGSRNPSVSDIRIISSIPSLKTLRFSNCKLDDIDLTLIQDIPVIQLKNVRALNVKFGSANIEFDIYTTYPYVIEKFHNGTYKGVQRFLK